MPLTASGQMDKLPDGSGKVAFTRIMAGIEALILAGVLYLVNSVSDTKLALAQMQAASTATNTALAMVPTMNVRLVTVEEKVAANTAAIAENKATIREVEARQRLR